MAGGRYFSTKATTVGTTKPVLVLKPNKKRKKRRGRQMTIIRHPTIGGFPKSIFTRLKYTQSGSLDPGLGGANAVTIVCPNGIYDVDISGGGHSPRGFTEWMARYDHYFVRNSKIDVTFFNADTAAEVMCGIALRDDVTAEVTTVNYQEQDCVSAMLPRAGAPNSYKKLTRYYSYSKQNFKSYTDAANKGVVNDNPSEKGYWHIYVGSPWGDNAELTQYTYDVYYDVLFTELKPVTIS